MPKGVEKRNAALLDVAKELFIEKGYKEVSLDMVIARAGGSRRNIYNRFGSKKGLFIATIEARLDEIVQLISTEDREKGDPEEVLTRIGIRLVTGITNPGTIALFRTVIAEINNFPEIGEKLYQQGPLRSYKVISNYLKHLVKQGYLSIPDCDQAAIQLVEMMRGHLQIRSLLCTEQQVKKVEIEQNVKSAVNSFLKMYATESLSNRE